MFFDLRFIRSLRTFHVPLQSRLFILDFLPIKRPFCSLNFIVDLVFKSSVIIQFPDEFDCVAFFFSLSRVY